MTGAYIVPPRVVACLVYAITSILFETRVVYDIHLCLYESFLRKY
jgi:hypothetical protein